MYTMLRTGRWIAVTALAAAVGILPSCATMGGGMRYFVPDTSSISGQTVST